jgi:hypothetical protein
MSVGDVINDTFSIYGQNAFALLGSAIVVWVIFGFCAGLLEAGGGWIAITLAAIIRMAGLALYTGFVVRLVQDVRDGRRDQTVGDLFSSAGPAILSLIVFGVIYAIGVAIGLALLIIPGLILITFWSVGAPAIVVERADPFGALGRSWRLVRGDAWSVFGTLARGPVDRDRDRGRARHHRHADRQRREHRREHSLERADRADLRRRRQRDVLRARRRASRDGADGPAGTASAERPGRLRSTSAHKK